MSKTTIDTTVKISRVIRAPRDQVFAAWADRDLRQRWWGPEGVQTLELVFDVKVGGALRWVFKTSASQVMAIEGTIQEVSTDEKLLFTWSPRNTPSENWESLVTVELIESGNAATNLRLTQSGLPDKDFRDEHATGWNSALGKLERMCEAAQKDARR